MAHPDVTRQWGQTILEKTNYMFISVTALADRDVETTIEETTRRAGTRAFVPHGGVVGMDALLENRDVWESVDVVMKKPPHNVDCAGCWSRSRRHQRRNSPLRWPDARHLPALPAQRQHSRGPLRTPASASTARTRCCW